MKENISNGNGQKFKGWFRYEEDNCSAPEYDPETDPHEGMWRQVEEMKREAEADGGFADEDWMSEKFLELDREYENEPPTDNETDLENLAMIKIQREFQIAAEFVSEEFSKLPEVLKVAAFGPVVSPLGFEVPRFRKFRRAGVAIRHECKDLDLAVWMSETNKLRELQKARSRALQRLFDEMGSGVAHHQVEVLLSSRNPPGIQVIFAVSQNARREKWIAGFKVRGCEIPESL